jgi:PAS domain S-box-containing protein
MKLSNLFIANKSANMPTRLPANLQTDEAKFKAILETIEDGVVLMDDQQAIQMINPGASAICGWSVDESTGLSVSSVLQLVNSKGVPIDEANNPILQVFKTGQSSRSNNSILMNHDKQQIPINLKVSPLADENNKLSAVVAIFSNVSEQRAEEQQRADFISTASHEMRTPVAAIEGYLALSLNEKVATIDSRARDFLEKAHTSTQHLGKLFQDLLTSAKAEDGRLTSHPSVIELSEFMQQLAGDFHVIAEKKGLYTDFVSGSGNSVINATTGKGSSKVVMPLYYVYADSDRLREVITNLFDNAVKYTSEGKITIGLTGNEQVVQCSIKDTGPGIPVGDIPHLFQKFYRVDNSATRTIGGTGLGLFICRKIIELYNGRIWAESKLGEGSSFYINLPRLTTTKASELQAAAANSLNLV